jgi:hypothetical protein
MADKVKKKRDYSRAILIAKVSVFWVLLAGVIVLVQQTDKAAYTRGMSDGYNSAATTIRSK